MLGKRKPTSISAMFETRSHAWEAAGLSSQISTRAAKRARRQLFLVLPAFVGVVLLYTNREQLFGAEYDEVARIVTVAALLVLGWALARDIGRALGPVLFRRLDPGTAGTVGFLIRLVTIGVAALVALRIAGVDPRTLVIGASFSAVIIGLAAQQTLGNLFAGTVLLSARPFRVGDRVRFQGGPLAGTIEGVVSSLGLLYTMLADGDERIMIPNSVVLQVAIKPVREPDSVDLRARLPASVRPSDIQARIQAAITVDTRRPPDIVLEEYVGDEVVVRILATPKQASEGSRLADEILAVVSAAGEPGADGVEGGGDGASTGAEASRAG
ncbi:MAG: mechanosensitive ion channel family protein [Solirubrobacteraceae bacterium]